MKVYVITRRNKDLKEKNQCRSTASEVEGGLGFPLPMLSNYPAAHRGGKNKDISRNIFSAPPANIIKPLRSQQ